MTTAAFNLLSRPIQQILWDLKWTELRPIQVAGIRHILTSKDDALITARTAAGKTEAAFLPILSELHESPPKSIGAIYVGPLKALINDQFQRLEQLCERAEIPVHRWHGDVERSHKAQVLAKPSGVLLITPESLESMFVNRSSALSVLFGELKYVVIDEIHSVIGRERGTQLRSLLFRLSSRIKRDFRIVGLSATVGDNVEAYARWIRPSQPGRVTHLHDVGEQKRVQFGIFAYERDSAFENDDDREALAAEQKDEETPDSLVQDILHNFCGQKNLLFCNRREDVEWLADRLNEGCAKQGRPAEFLVHHGALSREIREYTEQQMKQKRPATTICSSTLELGIDIGSVATVGQLGPPWSVNSQVQRLGRSGRRDGEPHVMRVMLVERRRTESDTLVDRLYPRLLHAIAVTELMKEKWVEPPQNPTLDFSTLVQQVLSILAETGGCRAQELFRLLVTDGFFRQLDHGTFAELLRSLGARELIEQTPEGLLLLAPAGEKVVHDRDFYSAFATEVEFTVTHDGRQIGMLPAVFVPNVGDHLVLGGRRWLVSEVDERRHEIQVRPAQGRKPPRFTGREGDVHSRVRESMQRIVLGQEQFPYLNSVAVQLLEDARNVARQAGLSQNRLVATGPASCLWFTWIGTRGQQSLCLALKKLGLEVLDQEIAIEFKVAAEEVCARLEDCDPLPFDAMTLARSSPIHAFRKFDEYVSESLLTRGIAADRIDLGGISDAIREIVTRSVLSGSESPDPLWAAGRPAVVFDQIAGRLGQGVNEEGLLSNHDFIAFDVETTGFMPVVGRIVEIAAVRFRIDGRIVDKWGTLVDPGRPIRAGSRAVHGITDEMVRGAPSEKAAAIMFAEFVNHSPAILVAHNAPFDLGFVSAAFLTNDLSLPKVETICSLELARNRLSLQKYSLVSLARHFGIENPQSHRAAADTEVLAAVLPKLVQMPPGLATTTDLSECCSRLMWDDGEVFRVQPPTQFAILTNAIANRERISIHYETASGQLSELAVTPSFLIHARGREYLVAHCHVDQIVKTYRFDRIRRVKR